MRNETILKLKRLKKKIEVMPDNYQRALLIDDYYSLLSYLKDAKLINKKVEEYYLFEDETKYYNILNKNHLKHVHELFENNDTLLKIDKELLSVYQTGNLNKIKEDVNISKSLGISLMEDFFHSLGDDVYKIYSEVMKNRISYLEGNIEDHDNIAADGGCYQFNMDGCSYVNVKKPRDLITLTAAVHEIGHAYQFYLLRNHGNLSICTIDEEVMSLLFEKLFIDFIKNDFRYSHVGDNLWYQYHTNIFWLLIDVYLTSYFQKKDLISEIDSSLECKTNCSLEQVIKSARNIGYITDTMPHLNFYNYSYVIGNVISDYFKEKIEIDFKAGFKETIDFIQSSKYYSMKEILEKYASNLNYTKENIKNVIKNEKSYQKKK